MYNRSRYFTDHSPGQWADLGHPCGGKRQSPIDIVTAEVKTDTHLLNFTFVNFSSPRVIKSIVNDGQTGTQRETEYTTFFFFYTSFTTHSFPSSVKCVLETNVVEVSEGGLNGTYSALELHFRWGDDEHHPGSEHTVDGHRYPMEVRRAAFNQRPSFYKRHCFDSSIRVFFHRCT